MVEVSGDTYVVVGVDEGVVWSQCGSRLSTGGSFHNWNDRGNESTVHL